MAANVIMPKLGMAMREGKVAKWRCEEAGHVEEGDVIAEIETEKITYQIEAPISGILAKIVVGEGRVAAVGQVIGIIIEEGETFDVSAIPAAPPEISAGKETVAPAAGGGGEIPSVPSKEPRIKVTPIARKIAREKGIDVSQIKGTGPDGRITRDDVLAAAEAVRGPEIPEKGRPREVSITLGTTLPLTRMREIIGERLTASSRDVPHVYFSCTVDGTRMIDFRERFKGRIESTTGVTLSFNDIILKAVATIIETHPRFNASLEGKTIRIHEEVNIGLAVALEEGLVVPVLRRVSEKTLGQIALARKELLDKARGKKLTLDDLSGGTFTVSNLGQFNIDAFTSIINPPETAILSVAKMKERPVVIEGELAVRPTVNLGLSVDHRVVDGAMAAAFLEALQRLLEDPYLMCVV
jgi:pyruvate dehydrogenase E2 component (dihydrolipoamide acetyltransferase)